MADKKKELLFSINAKDCEWDYIRGSGKGGQHRNKTSSAVRCRHIPSGAIGFSDDTRSQSSNRKTAFRRMAETKTFRDWTRLEAARHMGVLSDIRRRVERDVQNPNITKTEVKDEKGRWVEWKEKGEKDESS